MLVNKFTRYVAFPFLLSLSIVGILRAYAVPVNKRMVPLKIKRPAPASKKPTLPASPKKATPVAAQRTGEQVYQQLCASCHGVNGEGGKGYKRPLTGDRSVGQLARFIHAAMPPDAPRKLPMKDAQNVANYIHGAFYSSLARARNKPARVELSRLTVRQYRNALTDLIGSFRKAEAPGEKRGLAAKYFKTRKNGQPILERVDPEVRFDFGTAGALPEQDDPYQFAMTWQGSILAADTGEYEFIVSTEQGATLWVNDLKTPLIDAQVKSGNSNEQRAPVFLLGGRLYPVRLEFFKGVAGVNDLKKLKEKPPQKASIALQWKMPKRAVEVIPQRCLFPTAAAPIFVATTSFPPDDRSVGYERGTSISKEWNDATTDAALETAAYVTANLRELSGVADDDKDRTAHLREFCRKFVTRAFRRPLPDDLARFFVDRQFRNAPNTESAIKRVVLLALKSPRFLYREVAAPEAPALQTAAMTEPLDPYSVASRLSFVMWDAPPDDELLKAVAAGELGTREQVMRQAERMAGDLRAWSKMRSFLLQWLKVDHFPDLAKDAKRFPRFDASAAADLRTSLELTLENIVWNEKSDFRELMLADKFFLNGRLARVYGELLPDDAPFQPVAMDMGRRTGILTHPYILASFGYLDTSSPIHRGVLIARNLLGRTLNPPPEAFTPLSPTLHPKLTTRQRVALQTRPSACSSCHTLINPLGFSLEEFDAIGSLRRWEDGVPIDDTGGYQSPTGQEFKFSGSRDLARFLADSEEVHSAFVERLFQNMVKQPVRAFGPSALSDLLQTFKANKFNMRRQMIETAVLSALHRPIVQKPGATIRPKGSPMNGSKRAAGQPKSTGTPRT